MVQVSDKELSILHKAIVGVREGFQKIKSPAAQEIIKMANEVEKIVSSKMVKANAPLGGSSAAAAISSTNKNLFEMFGVAHRIR